MQIPHISVLANEVKEVFKDLDTGILIDATLGFGGHSELLLKAHKGLQIIACDKDEEALSFAKRRLEPFKERVKFIKSDFRQIFKILSEDELLKVRAVLADIGLSSWQLDKDERGFSKKSNFLDMRMDKSSKFSAFEVVNEYSQNELERIFKDYAELKNAKTLAAKITCARAIKRIESAKELANIVDGFVKGRQVANATLVFQAIRIEVNKELEALSEFLSDIERLARTRVLKNCVMAVISFHSLEDGLIKNAFKKWATKCFCRDRCTCAKDAALGHILTKKPLSASAAELKSNSRSASAKLRAFKID